MGQLIYELSRFCLIGLYIVSLYFSLKVKKNPCGSQSLKSFYIYPLVGCCLSTIFILGKLHIINIPFRFFDVITLLFHYSFLAYLIYRNTNKNWLKYSIGISFLLLSPFIIYDIKNKLLYSYGISNFCLYITSSVYFYGLVKSPPSVILAKDPIFQICCGIFLGSGIIVPFALMSKFLISLKVSRDTLSIYGSIVILGYIIMNVFFIKALLCQLKIRN